MRLLMACWRFPTEPGHSYMTNELAVALVAAGHEVEVLLIDWDAEPGAPDGDVNLWNGVRVIRCTPRRVDGLGTVVRHASKFVLTGRRAAQIARKEFDLSSFDAFMAWAPALVVGPLVGMARKAGVKRRLLFIWDFFPDHHRQIGHVPGGPPFWIARALEQRLMDQFTVFLPTMAQNAAYLRRRYAVRPGQAVRVTPIWCDIDVAPECDRAAVRRRYDLPEQGPIAVFGGQFVEGRGFDQILAAANLARVAGSPLHFLFVGAGRLAPALRDKAGANVLWRPAIPRRDYLELLGACDVGMVATVPGVTSYTIPSKTLDYLRAALPVVAAIETGSEFAALLERYGVGRAVPFTDAKAFFEAAAALVDAQDIKARARACLEEVFHVRHAVAAVLEGG